MSNLRAMREHRGLTQQQLADLVRPPTSQAQIGRLEKNQRKLTKEWALRLAGPLECHWSELIGVEAKPLPPRQKALLDLYDGLSEADQNAVFRHAASLAKSPDDDSGQTGTG